jgi:cell division protein FtsN
MTQQHFQGGRLGAVARSKQSCRQRSGILHAQRGGTLLGLIVGLVIGLALALGVAVYVTKVPVPFVNKGQSRTTEQDAAEAKKNKDWDPNAPLYGKTAAKPVGMASGAVGAASGAVPGAAPPPAATVAPAAPPVAPAAVGTHAAKVDPKTDAKPDVGPSAAGAVGDAARAKSSAGPADPFVYFVQAGAFRTPEDAEAQRARLQLGGFDAKVTEREQSGRPIYRVRAGPFERKDEADKAKERMDANGMDTALVRVQR